MRLEGVGRMGLQGRRGASRAPRRLSCVRCTMQGVGRRFPNGCGARLLSFPKAARRRARTQARLVRARQRRLLTAQALARHAESARSRIMAGVRCRDTRPEMAVRRLVHGMGYRYRLHDRRLPGCPDLVFAGRRKAVFVHGCFWHLHPGCREVRMPRSRTGFWLPKLQANRARDQVNEQRLLEAGWQVLVIWECQLSDLAGITRILRRFLDGGA